MEALVNDWPGALADEETRQAKAALSQPLNAEPGPDM